MNLVMGLGNPGEKYSKSRHNAGFSTLDCIARTFGAGFLHKPHYDYFERADDGVKTMFLKPQTFMNLSGNVFSDLRNIQIDRLIVVCDNIDLELGKIRFRNGGGSAGHNGLKSIMERYPGHSDFYRMYIGVGRDEGEAVSDMVIKRLPQDKFDLMVGRCSVAANIIIGFLKDGDFARAQSECS